MFASSSTPRPPPAPPPGRRARSTSLWTINAQQLPPPPAALPSRRAALAAALLSVVSTSRPALAVLTSTADAPPATPTQSSAPNAALYDAGDARLRAAANMLQTALNAESLDAEEAAWTAVIDKYGSLVGDDSAPWAADIVGRAYGNRGNARSRAGRADAAIADLNTAIKLCPWSVDPVLNRGVVLEQSGRLTEAERDYRAVLEATGLKDPSGWNNLANVQLLQGKYEESEIVRAGDGAGA